MDAVTSIGHLLYSGDHTVRMAQFFIESVSRQQIDAQHQMFMQLAVTARHLMCYSAALKTRITAAITNPVPGNDEFYGSVGECMNLYLEALEKARVAIDNWANWINEEYKDVEVTETLSGVIAVKTEEGARSRALSKDKLPAPRKP